MSNLTFGNDNDPVADIKMQPAYTRKSSAPEKEEEKLNHQPILKTNSHNINEKSNGDRFIPCRSYLESSHSLILNNVDYKQNKSYSSGSDTSREDSSSIQNYNALLESQFFGGDDALNEMNLSWINQADNIAQPDFGGYSNIKGSSKMQKENK